MDDLAVEIDKQRIDDLVLAPLAGAQDEFASIAYLAFFLDMHVIMEIAIQLCFHQIEDAVAKDTFLKRDSRGDVVLIQYLV